MNLLFEENKDFAQVYEQYVDMVYRICFMYLKNKSDTEDAVQTTFVKYMEYHGSFQDSEHCKAWLIVTSSNTCKNMLRHWWRKNKDISLLSYEAKEDFKERGLLNAVLDLPKKYKTAIYLYYYEGYTSKEISGILKRNESTVRSWLRTGRDLLKDVLGGNDL